MWQEAAALRDFNPTFVRFGSDSTELAKGDASISVRYASNSDLGDGALE